MTNSPKELAARLWTWPFANGEKLSERDSINLAEEAADALDRQQAEIERLRDTLLFIKRASRAAIIDLNGTIDSLESICSAATAALNGASHEA